MKLWETGPFDNESAKEFVQEVQEDGVVALQEAFEVVLDPELDYLEAEEAARAIAAAEVVRAALSKEEMPEPAELRTWLRETDREALEPLRPLAARAVARVLEPDSEWPELWAGQPGEAQWHAELARLLAQLGAIPPHSGV